MSWADLGCFSRMRIEGWELILGKDWSWRAVTRPRGSLVWVFSNERRGIGKREGVLYRRDLHLLLGHLHVLLGVLHFPF